MAARQVYHMDVVAHAGAVRGGVIVAEHMHLFQFAHGHLGNVGHQVVGDAVRVLANQPAFVRANGVEIAQQSHVHGGVCLADVGENVLVHHLGGAVGVGGGAHGEIFADGHAGRVAVHRGGRGEHKVLHAVFFHGVQHVQRADEVVRIIFQRLCHAFAHGLVRGKVNHRLDARVRAEHLVHRRGVAQVDVHKGHAAPGNLLYTAQGLLARIVQVVRHQNFIAGVHQLNAGVAANIAGAAAYQNRHASNSSFFFF